MVFIFGMDVPLVELTFLLTIILILLAGLMIYTIILFVKLSKKLDSVVEKEKKELNILQKLEKGEKLETEALTNLKEKLDSLVTSEAYAKKIESLLKKKKKSTEKEKVKTIAEYIWNELVRASRKK
ncbi:hypothetical protein GF336_01475 [Candidatus Woesearchaeota archaeon]|nr:hypothetical protein [Candidatus Woesearchaeota archaeon]